MGCSRYALQAKSLICVKAQVYTTHSGGVALARRPQKKQVKPIRREATPAVNHMGVVKNID